MSICLESQSACQCLFVDPVFDKYNIVDFVKCVACRDGRAPEINMLAKRCTLFRRVIFCLVFKPLIQITAPYERLGLTTAVQIHFMFLRINPQVGPKFFLHCIRMPLAFLHWLIICSFQVSLLSRVTPKGQKPG